MGFSRTLNALLAHLPRTRQSLLFSATQTDSVKDLARLSLNEPIYVGVKEVGSEAATPKSLDQHYTVCELDKKLDVLWSFIKSHLQCKILIFLSSGKQVRGPRSTMASSLTNTRYALSMRHSASFIRACPSFTYTASKSKQPALQLALDSRPSSTPPSSQRTLLPVDWTFLLLTGSCKSMRLKTWRHIFIVLDVRPDMRARGMVCFCWCPARKRGC